MTVLITGGHGQLAADLVEAFVAKQPIALGRDALDISVPAQIEAALLRWQPSLVINTAAFHRVDLCEDEPEQSFAINAAAPQRLAAACRRHGATLAHVSTDYVFNGQADNPYPETAPVDPISVYGASKAAGELAVRSTIDRHFIIRTTGLFGLAGRSTRHGNFVETMLRLAKADKPISVVSDQTLTPSATRDVAALLVQVVATGRYGTYHLTNSGACSWYEFAREVFRLADLPVDLSAIAQRDWSMPARRPTYSVLAHAGLRQLGIAEPRAWQEALAAYFETRRATAE